MGRLSLAGLALALVLFSNSARAEDPKLPVVEEHRRWYGWQPLTCDALAFTAFYISVKTASADDRQAFYFYFQPSTLSSIRTSVVGEISRPPATISRNSSRL